MEATAENNRDNTGSSILVPRQLVGRCAGPGGIPAGDGPDVTKIRTEGSNQALESETAGPHTSIIHTDLVYTNSFVSIKCVRIVKHTDY